MATNLSEREFRKKADGNRKDPKGKVLTETVV